jgi:hypothetical protein
MGYFEGNLVHCAADIAANTPPISMQGTGVLLKAR